MQPLLSKERIGRQPRNRWYRPSEFLKTRYRDMGTCSGILLESETYISPFFHVSISDMLMTGTPRAFFPRGSRPAASRAIDRFGISDNFFEESEWNDDDFLVCVEPLQDWIFVRNALSISANLYTLLTSDFAQCPDANERGLLSRTMFEYAPFGDVFSGQYLAAPISFKGSFDFWVSPHKDYNAKEIEDYDKDINPLKFFVTKSSSEPVRQSPYLYLHRVLKGFSNVVITTQTPIETVFGAHRAIVPDRILSDYIVLFPGRSQSARDVLADAFHAMHQAIFSGPNGLWEDQFVFGDELAGLGLSEEDGGSLLGYKSLLPALWNGMIHHRGHKLITCETCGNTVLASTRGLPPKYCSTACRMQASRRRNAAKS